jgi:carboxyl-terminal processing protease
VSNGTSSGAEFVTGALQEGRHARVVGQHTMGKWSVQSLDDLPNGYAFKYTVSLFKTPAGRSFEGAGLAPDVEVSMDERDLARANAAKPSDRLAIDVQLRTAKELLVRKP